LKQLKDDNKGDSLFQADDDFSGHDEPAPHHSRSNVRDDSEWPHGT
jgi:hypothetical protein